MSSLQVQTITNITNGIPDAQSLSQGQTWQNVSASRVGGTTYTNNTGRPIAVSIVDTGDGVRTLTVDGVIVGFVNGGGIDNSFFAIVPNGSSYVYTAGATASVWTELR